MSSVILMVGQCGNQVGRETMKLLNNELSHRDGKLRCVCVDSEAKVISSSLKQDQKKSSYREGNSIAGKRGRGNNWALGYHGLKSEEKDEGSIYWQTMDCLRKEVERCDSYAGTILIHSLSGGTGGGLGSRLAEAIRDKYPLAHLLSVAMAPHTSGESPLQNYNSLLCLAALQRYADGILLLSNDDVMNRLSCQVGPSVKTSSVSLSDMNQHIASCLSGIIQPLGNNQRKPSQKPNKYLKQTIKNNTSTLSSTCSNLSSVSSRSSCFSDCSIVSNSDTMSVMGQQPRNTSTALMRYRGLVKPEVKQSQSAKLDVSVPSGNEAWEMMRSVCPEPSRKFAQVYHVSKPRTSWEHLSYSLCQQIPHYDPNGQMNTTTSALLVARGNKDYTFADSYIKIEDKLKSMLGCVAWNPFPIDCWISAEDAVGQQGSLSLTLCANTSSIVQPIQSIVSKASIMYKAGAYLHWYWKHGCSQHDFTDAFETLDSVVEEYRLAGV